MCSPTPWWCTAPWDPTWPAASAPPPDQFGQVGRVLGFHSEPEDQAYTELHHVRVVGMLKGRYGACLHQELVDTHQAHDVTERQVALWLPGAGMGGGS